MANNIQFDQIRFEGWQGNKSFSQRFLNFIDTRTPLNSKRWVSEAVTFMCAYKINVTWFNYYSRISQTHNKKHRHISSLKQFT